MQLPTGASPLTETFSWRVTTTAFIKSASKEAIPRAIPSAFRERALAVARGLRARHVSRHQSCHGLAVCRCAWIAGAKASSCVPRAAADGAWARAFHWDHPSRASSGPRYRFASHCENCCCRYHFWLRFISSAAFASSELGGDASRVRRFNALVVRDGVSARRRTDAGPVFSAIVGCRRAASSRHSPNACVGIREFQRAFSPDLGGRNPHVRLSSNHRAGCCRGLRKTWGRNTAPRLVQYRFALDARANDHRRLHPVVLISDLTIS